MVTGTAFAFWSSAPLEENPRIRPEQEITQAAESLPVFVEQNAISGGFTFDSVKPATDGLTFHDNISVKNVRLVAKGPVTMTLANVTTSKNLGAIGGMDTRTVGHVLAYLVVENGGHHSIDHVKFDVHVLLDEFRVSDE